LVGELSSSQGAADGADAAYHAAIEALFRRTTGGVRLGLDRMRHLLEALGNPQRRIPCIHVAGTNGKGSTVAIAAALLRHRRLRVGTYTSPHLVDFTERIAVDGVPVARSDVLRFLTDQADLIERTGATFFEATTALAFSYLANAHVDVAVIETGLGGRLDATNVVQPLAAAVTSIAIDHAEFLGDSLDLIAREKTGIFKPGHPAIIGESDPAMAAELERLARDALASEVRVVGRDLTVANARVDQHGTSFTLLPRGGERGVGVHIPLYGLHQATNAATAWLLVDSAGPAFSVPLSAIGEALAGIAIPGRFQREGSYILDVAHNPAGVAALAETLRLADPPGPIVAVFSALRDKDWRGMLRILSPMVDDVIVTVAPSAPPERVWQLEEVSGWMGREQMQGAAVADFRSALERARAGGATVLVTGSFHTVGDAMAIAAAGSPVVPESPNFGGWPRERSPDSVTSTRSNSRNARTS
jgi:dihydrofolate synthase/folylpolyglutamate synthase